MAVFNTIGQAFSDGWNKNQRNLDGDPVLGFVNKKFQVNSSEFYTNYAIRLRDKKDLNEPKIENLGESNTTAPYNLISSNNIKYENSFKLPIDIISDATKNYKFIYNNVAQLLGDYGLSKRMNNGKEEDFEQGEIISLPVVPSMFNPLYGLNIVGVTRNTPLFMSKSDSNFGSSQKINDGNGNDKDVDFHVRTHSDYSKDLSDCSIKTLVEESNNGNLGRCIYKYADFMYCKNLGKVSNNRLITLRRFPIPIGDDIWHVNDNLGPNISGDTGRLVTWLDDTNRLEDILKYNYSDSFIKKEAKFQDKDSRADSDQGGILGAAINLANPKYRELMGDKRGSLAGGGNLILNSVIGDSSWTAGRNETDAENRSVIWDRYDENRVYEPKGTVRETHLYEGKLSFTQDFTLTFDYELRAYENINPRTAFLDLLNNIQHVTYRKGTFWGGAVWWKGAPENVNGWKNANAFIDKTWDGLTDTLKLLATGELNLGDFFGSLYNKAKDTLGQAATSIGKFVSDEQTRINAGKSLVNKAQSLKVGDMLKGMIKNKLGRPSLYATNSILTGEPVGLWHVTIGNPRNPIMAMGNLIIENASIQHYGPLGLDDFPTGLKVTVNLKHAKPRDMMEIGKMYTMGAVGLGVPLARNEWEKFISNDYLKDSKGSTLAERRTVNLEDGTKKNVTVKYLSSPYHSVGDNGPIAFNYAPYDTHQISTMWASTLPSKNLGRPVSNNILNASVEDSSNK